MQVFGFDPDLPLERGWTPPVSWYAQPGMAVREAQLAILGNWQPVGRLEQIAKPGDYFSGAICGQPYVVLRDPAGEVRAFHNVCRHHAAEVAVGCGAVEQLVCPYHGWTYNLEGKLKKAPGLGRIEDFHPDDFSLPAIPLSLWGPWIWLHFGEPARDLAADLAPLARLLEPTRFASLKFVERRTYEIECNWKVYIENYLDGGYHVETVHKGLAGQLDLDDYRLELFERCNVQSCGASQSPANAQGEFAERLGGGAIYAWVHPNFMINRYGPIMDTNWVLPLSPTRTQTVFDYFFAETEGPAAREFIEQSLIASHQVQLEDIRICESVQRGLGSRSYLRGRYAPAVEAGMHQFHRLLAAELASGKANETHASG